MDYKLEYYKCLTKYLALKHQNKLIGGKSKEKRPSPTASATLYKVGTKKKGNDGNTWIVTETKSGVKRWKLYRKKNYKSISKDTHVKSIKTKPMPRKKYSALDFYDIEKVSDKDLEKIIAGSDDNIKDIYNKLKKDIIPELEKMRKYIEIIPLPRSPKGIYYYNYPGDYMDEKYGRKWANNYMYFVVYLDQNAKKINMDRSIKTQYTHMNVDEKIKLIKLFAKYLPKHFVWTGRNTDQMTINYEELYDIPKIDITKLKDDDVYPLLNIFINMHEANLIDTGIYNLNIIKAINKYFSEYFVEDEYGKDDVILNIYSVEKKDLDKIYPKLIRALDNAKKETDPAQKISSYSIEYWLDKKTRGDLD